MNSDITVDVSSYVTVDLNDVDKSKLRVPFDHQRQANKALKDMFTLPIQGYKGSILVLPTGAGKTYSAVHWICERILSDNIKVLWLAQSTYLLDQAKKTLLEEMGCITGRDSINLRIVSSNSTHQNSGTIKQTDDVLICTTQTAIKSFNNDSSKDLYGEKQFTPFRKYIESFKDESLLVVVDEAHHVPAYGCRTLLLDMKDLIPNLYILGLTATPMHNSKKISGWLWEIFDHGINDTGICYEGILEDLQTAQILAVPKYQERKTGVEVEVDDSLYRRLVNEHKELPPDIINDLAVNQTRNDKIVSDYLDHKEEYGKSLIFADRWYQCEYIAGKLNEKGVATNCVYSKVDTGYPDFVEGMGKKNNKDNDEILEDFKHDLYKVIVNVRMLTEGVDVPDIKTVIITRQTTSPILFRQMVGRSLRGNAICKTINKDYANIILFNDTWKKLIPWIKVIGEKDPRRPVSNNYPIELISINAVREACNDIDFEKHNIKSSYELIPRGWFSIDFTKAIEESETEELITVEDYVLAYEFNLDAYNNFLAYLIKEYKPEWADEMLSDDVLQPTAKIFIAQYFPDLENDIDEKLISNLVKLMRHVAEHKSIPEFIDFEERERYDINRVVKAIECIIIFDMMNAIDKIFHDVTEPWETLYKNLSNFQNAVMNAIKRRSNEGVSSKPPLPPLPPVDPNIITGEIRRFVIERDHKTCVCCDKKPGNSRGLQVDHIVPVAMGGTNEITNLQTLCRQCNQFKKTNTVDYRRHESLLSKPNELELFSMVSNDDIENLLARIVNNIYHCKAFASLKRSKKSNGSNYHTWSIALYPGNNPDWMNPNLNTITDYIRNNLKFDELEEIIVEKY